FGAVGAAPSAIAASKSEKSPHGAYGDVFRKRGVWVRRQGLSIGALASVRRLSPYILPCGSPFALPKGALRPAQVLPPLAGWCEHPLLDRGHGLHVFSL